MTAPLVFVDQQHDLLEATASIERLGYTVAHGFVLPPSPWDLAPARRACTGTIGDTAAARQAVVAAARGCALAVACNPAGDLRERLIADLQRIGAIGAAGAIAAVASLQSAGTTNLTDDQREILSLLSSGVSVPKAAERLFLSLRTAERRLAGARRALGVRSTAEAVLRYLELEAAT